MLKIISALTYLTRQGLAMRKGNAECDSNFYQLLKAWAKDDPILTKWLEKKRENFTSHEIQNEILMLMAHHITRDTCTSHICQMKLVTLPILSKCFCV